MQISLKQSEIEVALKNYVSQQGISLYARDVSIAFTAGRKESGISAEITIEDADIPFGDAELVTAGIPTMLLKSEAEVVELAQPTTDNVTRTFDEETLDVTLVTSEVAEPVAGEVRAEPAKPVSLFG